MGNGVNLFDLAAAISISTANSDRVFTQTQGRALDLDRTLRKVDATAGRTGQAFRQTAGHTGKLSDVMRGLNTTTTTLQGPLGNIAGRFSSLGTLAPQLTTSLGAIGVAVGALAVISVGAAVGIYKLVAAAAETAGKFYDLSQQTGFSVETLSALGSAAETSGGSIETISAALGIFQKNMEAANEGDKEASRLFKALNIDIHDNELALRQAFAILSKLPAGAQQTALSMKLFGRSGREVQAVFKETGGDIDGFMQKLREMGTLITTDAARRGDELSDSITVIGRKLNAVGRQAVDQFAPLVVDALSTFSKWLKDNQTEIINTVRDVSSLIKETKALADFFYSISPLRLEVEIVRKVREVAGSIAQLANPDYKPGQPSAPMANAAFETSIASLDELGKREKRLERALRQTQDIGEFVLPGTQVPKDDSAAMRKSIADALRTPSRGGGGGGGGADPAAESRRLAGISLRATLDGFKAQEDALKRNLSTRRIALEQFTADAIGMENKQRDAVMASLDAEARAAARLKKGAPARLKKGAPVALAEIQLKKREEERRSAESIIKYIDSLSEDMAQRDRIREEGMLRVKEIVAGTEKDLWQQLADQRVINQEVAVKAIAAIERDGMVQRMALAQSELGRAGADKTKQLEARMQMGEIEAQMGALSIETDRRAAAALKARLAAQRDFNGTLEQTLSDIRLQGIELQKQSIFHQVDVGGSGAGRGRVARRAVDALDVQQENISSETAKRQLFLNLLRDMEQKSFAERRQLYEAFLAQRGMLEAQHVQTVKEINERHLIELRQQIDDFAADLTNALDRGLRKGFESGVGAGALEFLNGLLEMIKSQALRDLQEAIAGAIMKGFKDGAEGGGSIWSQIAHIGLSLLGSLFGSVAGGGGSSSGGGGGDGSGGYAGLYAAGGLIPKGQWGIVHDNERVFAGPQGATVIPSSQRPQAATGDGGSVVHNHVHINVPTIQAAGSGATQHQVARAMLAMMEKNALTR
ncbi:MAG TPA: hypothetical protein VMZ30_02080 [Pyrinomonadaceae bacterium]|nr:hypothetical protein [Pyrinomonadaceae bacterium]